MKMEGFPSTWCPPRLVIPAPWSTGQNSTGGIQVCCAELAWIPAFAGMTEPRRASWFSSPNGYFQRRHEGHEGFGYFILLNFVLFVTFVVICLFLLWLRRSRAGPCASFVVRKGSSFGFLA